MTELEALLRSVDILGGQSAMARELTKRTGKKVKQQHIYNWINRSECLPARFALATEAATKEKGDPILAKQLCPEVFNQHAA